MSTQRRWGSGARVDDPATGKSILLNAANDCFAKNGVKGTTIEDIAQAANVTRRTVYRYFSGKADILEALADAELDKLFVELAALIKSHRADFATMVEECIWHAANYQPPTDGEADLISEVNSSGCAANSPISSIYQKWQQLLEKPLEEFNFYNDKNIDLNCVIQVASRLVLSYRQYPTSRSEFSAVFALLRP